MFDEYSNGLCPQCLLDDQHIPIVLNTDDFWECPICHLQARSGGGLLVILHTRGNGDLKDTKASSTVEGLVLSKTNSDDPFDSSSSPVQSEVELRDFLTRAVHCHKSHRKLWFLMGKEFNEDEFKEYLKKKQFKQEILAHKNNRLDPGFLEDYL